MVYDIRTVIYLHLVDFNRKSVGKYVYIYIYVYKDHTWILWEKLTNFLFSPVVVMSTKPPKKQLPTAESLRKKSGLVYDYHLETHTIIYHPCMVYLPSIWLICMVFM